LLGKLNSATSGGAKKQKKDSMFEDTPVWIPE
jgi:hypothetical protein